MAIGAWAAECGSPKFEAGVRAEPEGLDAMVEAIIGDKIKGTLCGPTKVR